MNRRNFLKFLGTATIGTGIVYSFPSIIVPKNLMKENITFELLNKLYEKCVINNVEPNLITVTPRVFSGMMDISGITLQEGLFFRRAKIESSINWEQMGDNEIRITGELYGNCGRFKI